MRVLSVVTSVAISVTAVRAGGDLAKIDRTIVKEPAYKSKLVKYCLLVFGPEAKTRVWLVQDGDRLYVDRNGNGDLTESSERVNAKQRKDADVEDGVFAFEAGDIQVGTLVHKDLRVHVVNLENYSYSDEQAKAHLAKTPKVRGYYLGLQVEMPGRKGRGLDGRVQRYVSPRDARGFLEFGNTPQNAPIVHFDGPLTIAIYGYQRLAIGRENDLTLGVGTPGLGAGTTAFVDYEGVIPKDAYPKVEIEYPAKNEGDTPVKEIYELKQRC
jgi:hypothetical protein